MRVVCREIFSRLLLPQEANMYYYNEVNDVSHYKKMVRTKDGFSLGFIIIKQYNTNVFCFLNDLDTLLLNQIPCIRHYLRK